MTRQFYNLYEELRGSKTLLNMPGRFYGLYRVTYPGISRQLIGNATTGNVRLNIFVLDVNAGKHASVQFKLITGKSGTSITLIDWFIDYGLIDQHREKKPIILSRKRENWNGKYMFVVRNQQGRIISRARWTRKDSLTL